MLRELGLKQVLLFSLGFSLGFGEGFDAMLGEQNFLPGQKLGNRQDLEAGVAARKIFRLIETSGSGLGEHRFGGLTHGDESADGGFVPRQHALQVADVVHARVAAFDLHDDLLGLAALVVKEVDVAVDAAVRAFPVVPGGTGVYQVHGPPLELVRADFLERLRASQTLDGADDLIDALPAIDASNWETYHSEQLKRYSVRPLADRALSIRYFRNALPLTVMLIWSPSSLRRICPRIYPIHWSKEYVAYTCGYVAAAWV